MDGLHSAFKYWFKRLSISYLMELQAATFSGFGSSHEYQLRAAFLKAICFDWSENH